MAKTPGKPRGKVNMNIGKAGKKTQFGKKGGADPKTAGKKGGKETGFRFSVREQLQYLLAQPISSDMAEVDKEMKRLRKFEGLKAGETTGARLVASRLYERMVKKAEPQMAQVIMENMEGKLSQEITMPPGQKSNPGTIKPEDAEAAYKKFIAS